MNWNNLLIVIYVLLLIFNGYSWYKYNKSATADQKKKEGWTNYYLIATIFILILLFNKLGW
ncbi:hypothetical protein EV143_107215 [Flavobacterium chryseum]|uniref:hypothetical protein n=1 Tax=Flavobacterium sp. P3160 TaxID=2512113 RepID=UPI001060D0A9|nr:hypothetical protein [Flavobacterium sp. P3160]TDO72909.1 hypothetical protein EV143_107215 [Flavobacterium sp. P3160]